MTKKQVDACEYKEWMECINSDIMDRVLNKTSAYNPDSYTPSDVVRALASDSPGIDDFASLLSPAAKPYLEKMAERASEETRKHFGNSVCLFTPMYASNYCQNECVYCGFNVNNKIIRAKLDLDEVSDELDSISKSGLREILILTGESPVKSDVDYISECVRLASERFAVVGVEVYPMNSGDYAKLHKAGADYVTVFQETYDPKRYAELHLGGPKRIFSYRFDAQERALMGGMRGVAFGALLGLGNFRKDAFSCGLHAHYLRQKYPHAEISFSLPRLRPCKNAEDRINPVSESDLLQVSMAYRIFMPYAGQTISTRERPGFRDGIVGLTATKISAGVSVGIGEHSGKEHGDGQFIISDPRSVDEIIRALKNKGLQPVMSDYVRTDLLD